MKAEDYFVKAGILAIANLFIFGLAEPYLISSASDELVVGGIALLMATVWVDIKLIRTFIEKSSIGDEK